MARACSAFAIFLLFISSVISAVVAAATARPHRLVTRLIHRDSVLSPLYNPHATVSDRAAQTLRTSIARAAYLNSRLGNPNSASDILPDDRGLIFFLNLGVGEPLSQQLVMMDTGSSLLWIQCRPCDRCFRQQFTPIFDPSESSTFVGVSCYSPSCRGVSLGCDFAERCTYSINYSDRSSSNGVVAGEKLTFMNFGGKSGAIEIPNALFGCGHNNNNNEISDFSGVLGLGANNLSLVSRFGVFSYCIGNLNDPRYLYNNLILGDEAIFKGVFTPIHVHNNNYYLSLHGISLGESHLDIDPSVFKRKNNEGGVIIDSGSALSFLTRDAFEEVRSEVEYLMDNWLQQYKSLSNGHDALCYEGDLSRDLKNFPVLTFHFAGRADLVLNVDSLFYKVDDNEFCMTLRMSEANGLAGGLNVIGMMAQQSYNVVYDLTKLRIIFQKTDCKNLVE